MTTGKRLRRWAGNYLAVILIGPTLWTIFLKYLLTSMSYMVTVPLVMTKPLLVGWHALMINR